MIRVGILLPTYERSHYLEQALQSAAGQTYGDLEIIVIDNGSSPDAARLVERVADARIRYIQNERNLGLIGSIRKGMQLFSPGVQWCTILPDDDLLDRDYIRSMLDYVSARPHIDIVHGHWLLIDSEGRLLSETSNPPERETAIDYLRSRARFIRRTFLTGVFFSRKAYERIGGYPKFATGMASDDALIFALALDEGLFFNREAISSVRMHPNAESISSANTIGHFCAFEDYRKYVMRLTTASGKPSGKEVRTVSRSLDRFVGAWINALWIKRVQDLLVLDDPSSADELAEFYKIAKEKRFPFSLRVRFDVLVTTTFKWNPERSSWYRFMNKAGMRLLNPRNRSL